MLGHIDILDVLQPLPLVLLLIQFFKLAPRLRFDVRLCFNLMAHPL